MNLPYQKRSDSAPPFVTSELGWKYHHIGIPTNVPRSNERYLPELKMYVSGFEISPYGIEWMRFEAGSPVSELVQNVPHIAFEVDDLDNVMRKYDFDLLSEVSSPSEGVRVVMIIHNGTPVELMEFTH